MLDPKTPILVGGGQKIHPPKSGFSPSPIEMMAAAASAALTDCGAANSELNKAIDSITITRFIHDAPGLFTEDIKGHRYPFGVYASPPKSVAKALKASPKDFVYGPTGGNSPQLLINLTAERIAQGKNNFVVLAGTECLNSLVGAMKKGEMLNWKDDENKDGMEDLGKGEIDGTTKNEIAHGLNLPINIYPMFENAIRKAKGRTIAQHRAALGKLMARFASVAATHPQAWFPQARTAAEITTPSATNRMIGFPYTKYLNAIMRVDQAAALVMTNVETARTLGIPQSKWVFLHGCADATDVWYPTERVNYHSSPAIKKMGETAFAMANWKMEQVDFIDLYSCFPSAVQLGMEGLGIAEDDPRPLTQTGGLPYFGGAGNNYTMHSVATMMDKLRAKPGSLGLCTANGYYATKHSIGLYSTKPVEGSWQRVAPKDIQAELDAQPHPEAVVEANGESKLITYTIVFEGTHPKHGLMIGELTSDKDQGKRFCAMITDEAFLQHAQTEDVFDAKGSVQSVKGFNIWQSAP